MNVSLTRLWEPVRTSYWFVPAVLSLLAAGLSVLLLWVDAVYGAYIPDDAWWIYGGGPDGARAMLSAIIGSMITVTSIVFSITIVALTLAAGQFGTRLLRNFMRDTGNQIVLGTFVATFIYSLLILGRVRGLENTEVVPNLSITMGIWLAIASVGVLIFFIHHVSMSIQADSVISLVSKDLKRAIDRLYPDPVGIMPPEDISDPETLIPPDFKEVARPIRVSNSNYLQAVANERLMKLTGNHDLIVELKCRPGHFLMETSVVMLAWPAARVDDGVAEDLLDTLVLGSRRTITQDIEFGILEHVEIAARALSTGINDPFTAITCIDRLSAALIDIADRSLPSPYRFDDEGNLRLIADTPSFSDFVDAAYNQIRQNAGGSPEVMIGLMEALGRLAENIEQEEYLDVLMRHAERTREAGMNQFTEEHDRHVLVERFREVKAQLGTVGAEV